MNGTVQPLPSIKKTDYTEKKLSASNDCTLGGVNVGNSTHRKALLFSLWDGIFANGMVALVDTFAVAAAVYLNAPAIAIALLSSIPLLLSSIGQFFIPYFFNPAKGRKNFVINGCTAQSLSLLLLGCSGWLPAPLKPWAFVIFFAIYGFSGNVISSLWITWMGDLVPGKARGRHFAWRNKIFSIIQLSCALAAGFIVRKYSTATADWILFAVVFFTASIFRWVSAQILHFQYEPPVVNKNRIRFKRSDITQLRPFLLFCCTAGLMQGTAALSGPFFNVWFVRDLHFNFLSLSAAAAATVLGSILSLSLWGRLCDTIGNRRVLYFTGLLISLVPFPYIFFSQPWQICLLNMYSGISWSGYNLSYFNYILIGASTEKKVILSVAINGVFVFLFSILGGLLSTRLPVFFHWQLSSLFLLSGCLRLVIFLFLYNKFPRFETEHNVSLAILKIVPDFGSGVEFFKNSCKVFRLNRDKSKGNSL